MLDSELVQTWLNPFVIGPKFQVFSLSLSLISSPSDDLENSKQQKAKKSSEKPVRGGFYLTDFAKSIHQKDPHFQDVDVWLKIHFKIASNFIKAPVFYYFFNEFPLAEFTRTDFRLAYQQFLEQKGVDFNERAVKDDVEVLFKSYQPQDDIVDFQNIEDVANCPLSRLGLIKFRDKQHKVYQKVMNSNVSNNVLVEILFDFGIKTKKDELKFEDVLILLRPFNFDRLFLIQRLIELSSVNCDGKKIKFIRTAGLDVIELEGIKVA